MSETAKKLLPSLIALSAKDKAYIAQQLVESIEEEEEDAAFIAELDRRVEAYTSGKVEAIPSEDVHRRLREKYG